MARQAAAEQKLARELQRQSDTITVLGKALTERISFAVVVDIIDGDTLSIVHEDKQSGVRVVGIDCPKSDQPFGREAKRFTSDFCLKENIELSGGEIDREGRRLADVVVVNQKSLREALLSAGLAWHDTPTNNDPKLAKLQAEAKAAKVGLWADDDAVPPWEWSE